jgi:hypothetical protein
VRRRITSSRTKLRPYLDKRQRFRGIFTKFGVKNGYRGRLLQTIVLVDIVDTMEPERILTDHLWFNYTKEFQELDLKAGDILEFNARSDFYGKGYSDDDEDNPKRLDYHLTFPRKITKVGRAKKDYSEYDSYNEEIKKKILEHETRRHEYITQKRSKITVPEIQYFEPLNQAKDKSKPKIQRDKKLTEFFNK